MTSRVPRGVYLTIAAGAAIMAVAMGIRQSYGLVLGPATLEWGMSLSMFALAIALHNLVWGLAQPVAGAVADRFGAAPVVIAGTLAYALGLAVTAAVPGLWPAMIGTGVLVGIGLSCTSYGTVLAAVGRAAPAERRTAMMGLASAIGSIGGATVVPLTQVMIETSGVATALLNLALTMIALAPLAFVFLGTDRKALQVPTAVSRQPTFGEALSEAVGHRGYILLTLGFFTCGFQLAFFAVHFPSYLATCHLPAALGAAALAVFGGFNALGSWLCGLLGTWFRPQLVLGWIYIARGLAIVALVLLPKTEFVALAFAGALGLLGLGTVPLTSGLIARIFGTSNLGMLFGLCFLNHQIGAFLGAWCGGWLYEMTGSFDPIWLATAAAGGVAALLHFPIRDQPVARPAVA
jgi:MFS family permease